MRILRLKLFSGKYKNLSPFEIPKEWAELYDTVETKVHVDSALWEREITSLVGDANRDRAREMKKELKMSPYFLYNDNPDIGNERTHSLSEFSTDEYQVWSKDINMFDRLLYDIHKPKLLAEERKIIIDVVIQNLSDHKYKGKYYSETITLKCGLKIKL